MCEIKRKLAVLLLGLSDFVNTANAALNDLGNGLVNDDTLNITWMKDANLVKTSCDSNNALWQAFDPSALPALEQSGNTKAQICSGNASLNWFEAKAWIAVLNAQSYLGHNDWRQPRTTQPDLTCESTIASSNNGGYNCRGSELGHLFNATVPSGLENPNQAGTGTGLDGSIGTIGSACVGSVPHCFTQTGPFDNTQAFAYWSGTEYAPDTVSAWLFLTYNGDQSRGNKVTSRISVWPVRSGQSAVAPVTAQPIPTLSVWGLGIMSLLLAFVAQRKTR